MFTDVGFWEMTVIGVMALIVLGPERLPGAARSAGKWVGKARRMMGDMKRDIKAELDVNEMEGLKDIGKDIKEAGEAFKSQVNSADEKLQSGLKKETSTMDDAISDALGKETKTKKTATSNTSEVIPKVGKKKTAKKISKKVIAKKATTPSSAKTTKKKTTKKTAAKKKVAKKATRKKTTKV